jgi:hypothetical protein
MTSLSILTRANNRTDAAIHMYAKTTDNTPTQMFCIPLGDTLTLEPETAYGIVVAIIAKRTKGGVGMGEDDGQMEAKFWAGGAAVCGPTLNGTPMDPQIVGSGFTSQRTNWDDEASWSVSLSASVSPAPPELIIEVTGSADVTKVIEWSARIDVEYVTGWTPTPP